MADDSVPLPYPNLKVPEWTYQIQHVSRLSSEASSSLWKAIEADEMAPYVSSLPSDLVASDKSELISTLKEKNEKYLSEIDTKLKDAEENLGESDVSELWRSRAMYLCRIGDKERALPAIDTALEKTTGLGARIDLVLAKVRMGLFFADNALITASLTKALDLIDSGGDWDRRNRLKVYRALHHLSIRDFKEAADLLIDSLSTFTATELMEYEEFVALAVLAAGVGCDRKAIKEKIMGSSEVNSVLPQLPALSLLTTSLQKSAYADFFTALSDVEQTHLLTSPLLAPHARFYVREMRIKAYAQILESYRSLTLERMCRSFGVSEAFIDKDLSRFIAGGRLQCRIDKVQGVIVTNRLEKVGKTGVYENLVKQGDVLLTEIQKLHRVVG